MAVQNPTTNFSWDLPTEGGSSGTWDTLLNSIFGEDSDAGALDFGIDSVVGTIQTTANAALSRAGGDMTGEIDVLTERYASVSLSGTGTQTCDLDVANAFYVTPTATITFAFTNEPAADDFIFIQIEITNGTAQTVNWPAEVDWPGGSAPTLSANVDLITGYTRDGGTVWHLALAMGDSS